MQNRKRLAQWLLVLTVLIPTITAAQSGSINTFSPYTFYGLGDFSMQGPANLRSMGGAGVAFRDPLMINYLNPAASSAMRPKAFLFDFGVEGTNIYAKSSDRKTSFNTFNVRDIAVQFPIAKGMGFTISVTPLSNVGYRVNMLETNPEILATLGDVTYQYTGDGGVTQVKAAYGVEVIKNLSLGAEMIYYKGNTNRNFNTIINPFNSGVSYHNTYGTTTEDISRFSVGLGLQYNIIMNDKRLLTLGATYTPNTDLNPTTKRLISTSEVNADTISLSKYRSHFTLPQRLSVGLFYQTTRFNLGLDYTMQNWKEANKGDQTNGITFTNNHSINAGVQYTPHPGDVRHFYNRWSYRLGMRYNDYYMVVNNNKINDVAITAGIGIPIRAVGLSNINVGVELGQRGNTTTGTYGTRQFNMSRERYFKFSLGLSLFGEDYWFVKHKYK